MTDDHYAVVVNDEEQHSIHPIEVALPDGWSQTGFVGSRQACLDEIGRVWTDITPKSARRPADGGADG